MAQKGVSSPVDLMTELHRPTVVETQASTRSTDKSSEQGMYNSLHDINIRCSLPDSPDVVQHRLIPNLSSSEEIMMVKDRTLLGGGVAIEAIASGLASAFLDTLASADSEFREKEHCATYPLAVLVLVQGIWYSWSGN